MKRHMNFLKMILAILCVLWGGFFFQSKPVYAEYAYQDPYPQRIEGMRFHEIAEQKIRSALMEAGEMRRAEIQLSRTPTDMNCPAGNIICEAYLPQGLKYGGTTPVQIAVYVDDKPFRRVTCYLNLRVFDSVAVAARDLAIEQIVWSGDLRIEERQVALGTTYILDPIEIEGKVPSRVIRAGTPLTANMFRNPIAFETGAVLHLVFRKAGFEVSAEGIAMQRGRIGDTIRVRNASSNRILRAKVIDASTVEVI